MHLRNKALGLSLSLRSHSLRCIYVGVCAHARGQGQGQLRGQSAPRPYAADPHGAQRRESPSSPTGGDFIYADPRAFCGALCDGGAISHRDINGSLIQATLGQIRTARCAPQSAVPNKGTGLPLVDSIRRSTRWIRAVFRWRLGLDALTV